MITTGNTLTRSPPNNNVRITRHILSNINSQITDPQQQIQLLPGIPNAKRQQPNLFETNRNIINSNNQILLQQLQQQNQIMSNDPNNINNNLNQLNENNNGFLPVLDSANQPQAPNQSNQPVIISGETQPAQGDLPPNLLNQQPNLHDNENQDLQNFDQQQNGANQPINPNNLANSNNLNQVQSNNVLNDDYVQNLLSQLEAQRSALAQSEMERIANSIKFN
jgi:hypothetical protein